MNIRFEIMDLPCSIPAYVAEKTDSDGEYYTIFLNNNCSEERIRKAVEHELKHITNDDFCSKCDIDTIEKERHK